ncbi:MAG: nitroreductase family protein [Ignavibacteria bacterium]|nr:nitroreductase family protein [Ignavibacteria bacterium]
MNRFLIFIFGMLFCMSKVVSAQDSTVINLPVPQKTGGKPLLEALSERQSVRVFKQDELSLQQISNLLWAGFGVNRTDVAKRTAPSAKNWQDISIYVFLPKGVYLYDAVKNQLQLVHSGDRRRLAGKQEYVYTAPLNLVYVSDQTKMGDSQPEDKAIMSGADAAFIAENVYLYCASENLGVVVRAMIDREAVAALLQLKPGCKVVLAQTVGMK